MKVSGRGTTATTTPTKHEKSKKNPAQTDRKPADIAKEIRTSANRLAKVNSGRFSQIANPGKGASSPKPEVMPDDVDLRAKMPEGSMPGETDMAQGSHAGPIDDTIAGPQQGNSVDSTLREEVRSGLFPDESLMMGGGKQVDGRDPNGAYRGGGPGMADPDIGVGKEAAGEPASLIDQVGLKIDAANAKAAAAEGNFEAVDAIASNVSSGLGKGPGSTTVVEKPSNSEKIVEEIKEGITNVITGKNQAGGGKTPSETQAQAAEDTINESAGTEKTKLGTKARGEQGNEAATEVGVQADGATTIVNAAAGDAAEKAKKTAEDREVEFDTPDIHGLDDFTDNYQDMKIAAMKNSEINPGDQMQGGPVGEVGSPNTDQYTANYGEGHTAPSKADIEAGKKRVEDAAGNDDEF